MPRAGSMWTYNVTRACIHAAGLKVLPEKPPVSEREIIIEAVNQQTPAGSVYCIKTHETLPLDLPDTRYICNVRDVRDALISYMRFMKCDTEFGLKAVQWMMDLTDHYMSTPRDRLLPIRYDDISPANPAPLVERIAKFAGLDLPRKSIKQIARRYTRSQVRSLIDNLNKVSLDEEGNLLDTGKERDFTSAPSADGTHRAYHRDTGFQARHITAPRDQEWARCWMSPQGNVSMAWPSSGS